MRCSRLYPIGEMTCTLELSSVDQTMWGPLRTLSNVQCVRLTCEMWLRYPKVYPRWANRSSPCYIHRDGPTDQPGPTPSCLMRHQTFWLYIPYLILDYEERSWHIFIIIKWNFTLKKKILKFHIIQVYFLLVELA